MRIAFSIFALLTAFHSTVAHIPRGTHQRAAASGLYTAWTTNWFTNNIGSITATDTLDGAANVTLKLWKNPNGATNRTQTLTWDARNRPVKVTDRDSSQTGKDWSAVYDALNRLLRTTEVPVTNGLAVSSKSVLVEHYYDPHFEFLETGVSENGSVTWKVLGPDLDGTYGGQNGTGGFEAIVPGPELFCPLVPDSLGNICAVYDQNHQVVMWYTNRVTAYGAVPGYRPVPLGQLAADLGAKSAYRNRGQQSIGYLWMGDNWYDPVSGQFLRHDTFGHNGSPNGRTPFRGNRYGYWDADGRLSAAPNYAAHGLAPYNGFVSDNPADSWQSVLSDQMTGRSRGGWDPFAPDGGPSLSAMAGHIGGSLVNAPLIGQSWHELRNPDFSTGWGRATFGVAVAGMVSGTADFAGNLLPGKAIIEDAIKTGIKEVVKAVTKEAVETGAKQSFKSFSAFKRFFGSAGDNMAWHHIVEQSQAGRFGSEAIHNTENVLAVGRDVNTSLNALYSSIRPQITGSTTLTVREWLSTKSYEEARAFGLQSLENVQRGVWP